MEALDSKTKTYFIKFYLNLNIFSCQLLHINMIIYVCFCVQKSDIPDVKQKSDNSMFLGSRLLFHAGCAKNFPAPFVESGTIQSHPVKLQLNVNFSRQLSKINYKRAVFLSSLKTSRHVGLNSKCILTPFCRFFH